MSTEQAIWLAGAALASGALVAMMHHRQSQLNSILRTAVQQKLEWSRKRRRAAQLARRAVDAKAGEEVATWQLLLSATELQATQAEPVALERSTLGDVPASQLNSSDHGRS